MNGTSALSSNEHQPRSRRPWETPLLHELRLENATEAKGPPFAVEATTTVGTGHPHHFGTS